MALSGTRWLLVVASSVVAFVVLSTLTLDGVLLGFVPAVVFVGLPLVVLAAVTGGRWTALFRRVSGRDVLLMFAFALLSIALSAAVDVILRATVGTSPNPAAEDAERSGLETAAFFLQSAVQILGEELFIVLPFLALLHLLVTRLGWSRRLAVLLCWVLGGLWFGLAHLPTYDWNLAQVLLVIGLPHLVIIAVYIRTKNIWVSTGAHLLNDWILFGIPLVLAPYA